MWFALQIKSFIYIFLLKSFFDHHLIWLIYLLIIWSGEMKNISVSAFLHLNSFRDSGHNHICQTSVHKGDRRRKSTLKCFFF